MAERFSTPASEFGIRPFGVEAQRLLRLEKHHVIVGVDTDALTNPYEADMAWAVKLDKSDFIGKAVSDACAGSKDQAARTSGGLCHASARSAAGWRGRGGGWQTGRARHQLALFAGQEGSRRSGVGANLAKAQEGATIEVRVVSALVKARVTLHAVLRSGGRAAPPIT